MPDRLFSLPRLAQVYDALNPGRADLEAYVTLLEDLGAHSVVDVGCGTGSFALLLVSRGLEVTAVDPAKASLDIARAKPGADAVTWVHADGASLPLVGADAVTMTGNVAQVFVSDEEWAAVLHAAHRTLRSGGHLVFETRDPTAQDWRTWTRDDSFRRVTVAGVGLVECWEEVTEVTATRVSFQTTFVFAGDGSVVTSRSTLRFRDAEELSVSLCKAGFTEPEIRGAPDRPGLELVFVAHK